MVENLSQMERYGLRRPALGNTFRHGGEWLTTPKAGIAGYLACAGFAAGTLKVPAVAAAQILTDLLSTRTNIS